MLCAVRQKKKKNEVNCQGKKPIYNWLPDIYAKGRKCKYGILFSKNAFVTIKASNGLINTVKIRFPQVTPKESSLRQDSGHQDDKWKANTEPMDISKTR